MDAYIIEQEPAESRKPYYIIAACFAVLLIIGGIFASTILSGGLTASNVSLTGSGKFSGVTAYGEEVSTANYPGKVIVVDFWATWCPPCVASLPEMNSLQEQYREQVQFVGVSLDRSAGDLKRFLDKHGASYPSIFDGNGKIANEYGIRAIPTVAIIDTNGSLRYMGGPFLLERNLKKVLSEG
ncbi:TlpA family protein disulfide reductase [Candidatus Sumerlaeota bacterium]|nr:TlpA family protein disulfide reductase [Candidatus Sumerlaeota bacterium]